MDKMMRPTDFVRVCAVLALCVVLAGLVAAPAYAQQAGARTVAGANLEELLKLNGDQRTKLRDIHARFRTLKRDLSLAVDKLRQQVVDQMSLETPDRAQVERNLQEIVRLEGRRQKIMVDELFDVLAVLRPDQRRLFREQVVRHMVRAH